VHIQAAVLLAVAVSLSGAADRQATADSINTQTLSEAIELAGPQVAALPIVLASSPSEYVSRDAEAWLWRGEDGRPRVVVVYTKSAAFRCASRRPPTNWQCRLKLASILVHEAWHFRYGSDERQAYDAQIAFLVQNGASSIVVTGVRQARAQAIARQRQRGTVQ
jgi:hypothetical protein